MVTDENKRNTCPRNLKVIPSACAFLCTIQYALFYTSFLSLLGCFFFFFLLTSFQGQSFFIPGTHHIREFSKQGCNLLKTFQDCVRTVVFNSAGKKKIYYLPSVDSQCTVRSWRLGANFHKSICPIFKNGLVLEGAWLSNSNQ